MNVNTNDAVTFTAFLHVWNRAQGMDTPNLHLKMASWLERRWIREDLHMLLMAFRSAGKSTIVGIFAAWLLYRNPDIRILVLAADGMLAGKMVRNVKRIIERHSLTTHLKPKSADQWASDKFTVNRGLELRDPSMMARGITANITGSRADIVICDDVEVPNTCGSEEKRVSLRERLAEMEYVLVAGGAQIYVGTPHDYYSIYADLPRTEIGEDRIFLEGFEQLCIPLLDERGRCNWPERYSEKEIERIQNVSGPNKFDSQMMLKFVNITEGRLDPDLLQFYSDDVVYEYGSNDLFIAHQKMVGVCCFWDPSMTEHKGGDDSVVAIVYADMGGNYYLHHLEYIKVDKRSEEAIAAQQVAQVVKLARRFFIPLVTVEGNGLGETLPGLLRTAMRQANLPGRVNKHHNSKAKSMRIIQGFDAVMAARRLWVHEKIKQGSFIMEMREWIPERNKVKDDALDAVSSAILCQPERLPRADPAKGQYSWMVGARAHKAKQGRFDV